jgi:hypothetical protein
MVAIMSGFIHFELQYPKKVVEIFLIVSGDNSFIKWLWDIRKKLGILFLISLLVLLLLHVDSKCLFDLFYLFILKHRYILYLDSRLLSIDSNISLLLLILCVFVLPFLATLMDYELQISKLAYNVIQLYFFQIS